MFFYRRFQQARIVQSIRFGGGFKPLGYGNGSLFTTVFHILLENIWIDLYRNHHITFSNISDFVRAFGQRIAIFFHSVDVQG